MDRIGKQLEAVMHNILIDLAPTPEKADQFRNEWKETKGQYKKEQREFYIFWGIVFAAIFVWWFWRHG